MSKYYRVPFTKEVQGYYIVAVGDNEGEQEALEVAVDEDEIAFIYDNSIDVVLHKEGVELNGSEN